MSRSLTAEDRRHVSRLLDDEILMLDAAGKENAEDMAQLALRRAVKKYRQSQGVASRVAQGRELIRRLKFKHSEKSKTPGAARHQYS